MENINLAALSNKEKSILKNTISSLKEFGVEICFLRKLWDSDEKKYFVSITVIDDMFVNNAAIMLEDGLFSRIEANKCLRVVL